MLPIEIEGPSRNTSAISRSDQKLEFNQTITIGALEIHIEMQFHSVVSYHLVHFRPQSAYKLVLNLLQKALSIKTSISNLIFL